MLKSLIASALLCASVSGGGQINSVDLAKRNAYGFNTFEGAYCLKDVVDYGESADDFDNVTYSLNLSNTRIAIYTYNSESSTFIDYVTSSFDYGCYNSGVDAYFLLTYEYDLDSGTFNCYVDFADSFEDCSINIKHVVIYFLETYYPTNDEYEVFTRYFSHEPNRYCRTYSGWYTFNNNINVNNIVGNYFYLYGNYIIDNNLYSQMSFNSTSHEISASIFTEDISLNISVYSGGKFDINNLAIYINGMFVPVEYYNYLSARGVFNYVYEPNQTTFAGMIFSVVDAPIYMLSQLFSFELFGMQFYVAFMGIITVLLIGFIVRKLI